MRLLLKCAVPFVFCSSSKLFCLKLKVGVGVILILERKKRFLVLYVSLSCTELDFVHLGSARQV